MTEKKQVKTRNSYYPRGTAGKVANELGLHVETVRKVLRGVYCNQAILDTALRISTELVEKTKNAHETRKKIAELNKQNRQMLTTYFISKDEAGLLMEKIELACPLS